MLTAKILDQRGLEAAATGVYRVCLYVEKDAGVKTTSRINNQLPVLYTVEWQGVNFCRSCNIIVDAFVHRKEDKFSLVNLDLLCQCQIQDVYGCS